MKKRLWTALWTNFLTWIMTTGRYGTVPYSQYVPVVSMYVHHIMHRQKGRLKVNMFWRGFLNNMKILSTWIICLLDHLHRIHRSSSSHPSIIIHFDFFNDFFFGPTVLYSYHTRTFKISILFSNLHWQLHSCEGKIAWCYIIFWSKLLLKYQVLRNSCLSFHFRWRRMESMIRCT